MKDKPIILIAFGGNALIKKGQKGTHKEQFVNLKLSMRQIARLSRKYKFVITHGNGPQVGNLLLQQESCDEVPKMPLEIIGAMTQGQIGYMGPKVEAITNFFKATGNRGIICQLEDIEKAIAGEAGTEIIK
jgi:carbamate kinase